MLRMGETRISELVEERFTFFERVPCILRRLITIYISVCFPMMTASTHRLDDLDD